MDVPGCPRCGGVVALHVGHPVVTGDGSVELWHRACWDARELPIAPVAPPPLVVDVAPPRRGPRHTATAAGIAAVVVGVVLAQRAVATPGASMVNAELGPRTRPTLRTASTEREAMPPTPDPLLSQVDDNPIPRDADGRRLDEVFPTLRGWVHPISAASEVYPESRGRHFGALRHGHAHRDDCGEGHCGVDLEGPRGRALVAVAAGVVVRVERREDGGDGISGRWVRVQHDDGALTSYFHMEEIDPELEVGDRVRQGEYLGKIGSTGVKSGFAHLHFSLELPKHPGDRGDLHRDQTRFVDPAPFLVRAVVIKAIDRRHAVKPAM